MEGKVDIQEIHSILLKILIDFDHICRKNNLTYYMLGGTLLGAVRHNGFIPWDDDIDIGMPRCDYEKFINLPQTEFPEYLQVWNLYKKSKGYMMNFSKLVNVNTSMIPIENPDNTIGLFLDIFPIDGASKSSLFRNIQTMLIRFFQVLRSYKYLPSQTKKSSLKSLFMTLFSKVFSNYIHWIIEKLVTKHNYLTSSYAGNLLGVYGLREIMSKEIFGEPVELGFEGYFFYAPKEYALWLKNVYGDYMRLPSLDKRNTPHEYISIDLKRSCL